jgi:hypothetical protein
LRSLVFFPLSPRGRGWLAQASLARAG